MSELKFSIKKRSSSKSNLHPIYLEVHFNRQKRTLVGTGVKSDLKHWNNDKRELRKSHPDYTNDSKRLQIIHQKYSDALLKLDLLNLEHSKENLEAQFKEEQKPQKTQKPLLTHFDDFVEFKKSKVSKSVITDYSALKRHLEDFQKFRHKKLQLKDLEKNKLFDELFEYLTYHAKNGLDSDVKGLKVNTVGKQIKNMKVFIRHLMNYDVITLRDISYWKVKQVEVDSVALDDPEIKAIYDLKLELGSQKDIIRDLFILGCETGLRFNNFSSISTDKIKGKHFHLWDKKNKRRIVVPISPTVHELLKKYNNKLPTSISLTIFNREIKSIAKEADINEIVSFYDHKGNKVIERKGEKYKFISSHTCRRSFCTNWFRKGMPVSLIRRLSGHTTDKSFYKYIKISENEAADLMLTWWEKFY